MSDDGWAVADIVIDFEVAACELDPAGCGVLELVTDEGAHRIVWRRDQAHDLLDVLAEELDRLPDEEGP